MRSTPHNWYRVVVFICVSWTHFALAQDPALVIKRNGTRVDLSWPAKMVLPSGTTVFPAYEIQTSTDMVHWEPLGSLFKAGSGQPLTAFKATLERQGQRTFYRVVGNADPVRTASGGADVYGYSAVFQQELDKLGQLTVADFSARYNTRTGYLAQISWDPATAQYWFAYDPQNRNYVGPNGPLTNDFRLNPAELAVFKTNGFVVSERLGSYSFASSFYRIFMDDLPVYVSTDAVLHAWHRSFSAILEELEETTFFEILNQALDCMAAGIPETWKNYGQGPLRDSILDADYYVAVARSLLAGQAVFSALNQDGRVAEALTAINNLQLQEFNLFGSTRTVDFSQFAVRGHYDASERLRRYFRAMMWCGRIDLRITPGTSADPLEDNLRELGTAIVLNHFIYHCSGNTPHSLLDLDQTLSNLMGTTDSLTFIQLYNLLTAAGIRRPTDFPDWAAIQKIQADIMAGDLGFQNILSDYYTSPLGPAQLKLPRSYTVMGQRFVLDSWALAKVVYDNVLWDTPGPMIRDGKVLRRIPSCLDVAFSVMQNDDVVPDLLARLLDPNGRTFRDGLPYQRNLAAVRAVIDAQNSRLWETNMYMGWLTALRDLSGPTTDERYPEAMRTRPWAMKNLNSQLASWTQLRHDTLLSAKPSYTAAITCSYPAGFVEPRPAFWARMQKLATLVANSLNLENNWYSEIYVPGRDLRNGRSSVLPSELRQSQMDFLQNFANTMAVLERIAQKELNREPLTIAEADFLKDLMEDHNRTCGDALYSGWFPKLHYRNIFDTSIARTNEGSDKWDPLVTDVHTDVPALVVGDPGCVLHEGVGNVHMLIIAVDNGPDRMIYAGPVMSHFEFEMPGVTRKSDAEWKADIKARKMPPYPAWTQSYLVPGPMPPLPQ